MDKNMNKNKIIYFIAAILLMPLSLSATTEYRKRTSIRALKPQFHLDELELINIILRGSSPGASIEGLENSSELTVFDGRNYDLEGNPATGGRAAIGSNLGEENISSNNVTLESSGGTVVANIDYALDINLLAPFLRKNADIVIDEATVLENTTIGSSQDYKIVYVDDARLTLSADFRGYGILYIEDKNHNQEDHILDMLDNAKWHGVVLVYQPSGDKISKLFLNGSEIESFANISDFSMLGVNSLTLGDNTNFSSGDVGVSASAASMVIGNNSGFSGSLFGNTIALGNNNTIDEDVKYNTFSYGHNLSIGGDMITPLSSSYVTLPVFPVFSSGTQNISRGHNITYTLAAGSYNNLSFGNNCTLILSGGDYYINQITMGNNSSIKYSAPSNIHITKKVVIGNNSEIIPDTLPSPPRPAAPSPFGDMDSSPESGSISADDCIFYIKGDYASETDVFKMGNNSDIECNIYAPNIYSTINLDNAAECRGSIIGYNITAGNNISVSLESAFSGDESSSSEIRNASIYGSIILIGNQFQIPNQGTNTANYYCEEAIEEVNSILESATNNLWMEWRQSE
jgi:hypothetical protein